MEARNTIQVPIPDGIVPSEADLALITAACQSVASICLDQRREWFEKLRKLEGDEWQVQWGLLWSAEATKGRTTESVTAPTIEAAFDRLAGLAQLHRMEGCP